MAEQELIGTTPEELAAIWNEQIRVTVADGCQAVGCFAQKSILDDLLSVVIDAHDYQNMPCYAIPKARIRSYCAKLMGEVIP